MSAKNPQSIYHVVSKKSKDVRVTASVLRKHKSLFGSTGTGRIKGAGVWRAWINGDGSAVVPDPGTKPNCFVILDTTGIRMTQIQKLINDD